MPHPISRRQLLAGAAAATVASSSLTAPAEAATADARPLRYCLNTSTIRGQKLSIVEEIEIASQAGYDGIEPWIGELREYADAGGSLADLKKRTEDAGLVVESAIGFAQWIVDDEARRAEGLENARRDMELVAAIGGRRLAAPPTGATDQPSLNLLKAAQRYRRLLEIGEQQGVLPQLELWGFSANLHRLGEVIFVAVESGRRDACLLPDVYHIHKGGSDFSGLKLIGGAAMHVFHINDYPADPPRATIQDADRVYPGDGVAPLDQILSDLYRSGFRGALSLELFNRKYWQQDPLHVAQQGLAKMQAAVSRSGIGDLAG